MTTRTAVATALLVFIAAGCVSPTASPSASPTPEPTFTASPIAPPAPSTTPSTSETPSPTSAPVITAGPLTVAGELTFGHDNFGGLPYGQAASVYGTNLAPAVTLSACGDAVSPMLFATQPSTPPWGLFLITNWQAPGVALADATVQSFELVIQSQDYPNSPIGPVGPLGIRLGTAEATIQTMFPVEWGNHNSRSTVVTDADGTWVVVSERMVSVADVGGGPMILGVADGVVVTIMWGNPDFVHQQLGNLWCP